MSDEPRQNLAYFFDMDGTLIDSETIWIEAIQDALRQRGIELSLEEVTDLEYGRAWPEIFGLLKRRWPDAFTDILEMQQFTTAYYARVVALRDIGIHSSLRLLRRLARAGHPVYVVTGSTRERVEDVAASFGFRDCLAGMVTCGDYRHGKPDPECYLLAARRAGVDPAHCVVFEDALTGVLAAKRAGMWCVALNRSGQENRALSRLADLTVTDLEEFREDQLAGHVPSAVTAHHIALGLGGDVGDTEALFQEALRLLKRGGLQDLRVSNLLRTKPVDCVPGTPDFLNGALTGTWYGKPEDLLDLTQQVERTLGRPAEHSSHESRTVDLDMLLVDEMTLDTPRLTVPHPRLLRREFALAPLAELAPDWRIAPTMVTVAQALARLRE